MINRESFVDILARHKQGESIRKIARDLNVSRNTVRKYLRNNNALPSYTVVKTRVSVLENYKEYLKDRIESAKPEWIPATVLLNEIQSKGYTGKISILRAYIRQFKVKNEEKSVVRFETTPGKQMQIDFITVKKRTTGHFKAFVATLGYSRASFVHFFENEKTESWLEGLQKAFEFFGGVPQEILCDNAKALIVQRDAYGEGLHKYNSKYLDMSKYYGFKIKACRPYRPQTKGKVERFNSYLKYSFIIPLLTLYHKDGLEVNLDILNSKVGQWLAEVANNRTHGSINCVPNAMLYKEQENFLLLPKHDFICKKNSAKDNERIPYHKKVSKNYIQPSSDIFDILLTNTKGAGKNAIAS